MSKLILSYNQSNATLWVLDTCLIIGLRPLMIILITASLSSQKCTTELHIEKKLRLWSPDLDLTTVEHSGCLFLNLAPDMRKQFPAASLNPLLFSEASWVGDFLLFDELNTSITTSHKSRAGIPFTLKPASNEIVSDSVEL